jgi:hypothetical protein
MATKDKQKNRQYVAKSRAKLIASIGIEEYRRRNAESQRLYRAKKKALKNADIRDRRGRRYSVNDLVNVRKELKRDKRKI